MLYYFLNNCTGCPKRYGHISIVYNKIKLDNKRIFYFHITKVSISSTIFLIILVKLWTYILIYFTKDALTSFTKSIKFNWKLSKFLILLKQLWFLWLTLEVRYNLSYGSCKYTNFRVTWRNGVNLGICNRMFCIRRLVVILDVGKPTSTNWCIYDDVWYHEWISDVGCLS